MRERRSFLVHVLLEPKEIARRCGNRCSEKVIKVGVKDAKKTALILMTNPLGIREPLLSNQQTLIIYQYVYTTLQYTTLLSYCINNISKRKPVLRRHDFSSTKLKCGEMLEN